MRERKYQNSKQEEQAERDRKYRYIIKERKGIPEKHKEQQESRQKHRKKRERERGNNSRK